MEKIYMVTVHISDDTISGCLQKHKQRQQQRDPLKNYPGNNRRRDFNELNNHR